MPPLKDNSICFYYGSGFIYLERGLKGSLWKACQIMGSDLDFSLFVGFLGVLINFWSRQGWTVLQKMFINECGTFIKIKFENEAKNWSIKKMGMIKVKKADQI